ncbi:hypothetical protein DDZ14_10715 [Maritimibacter sp. 55A14]|uniref:hypothetical protein n=1 Tax=Maritimibacter sp. 55A14 TaxID=2174844 RepID=UPI000D61FD26|nr:hypothetical protein [Maritimibacter sp. 55A14]PWE32541.1 hypothetical protein DDZ14_10715 [Maritimibacter sp. 55A14]
MRLPGFMLICIGLGLGACAGREDLTRPPEPMGDFLLGHAIVVDRHARFLPPSRYAEDGEWKAALTEALRARLGRYDGTRYYHVAVNVVGYALAVPGVPLILSPKSALVVEATVWDDARKVKLNPEPRQFTVLESISPRTVIGSGLTQSREAQMEGLSQNAARQIHKWMLQQKADWFGAPLGTGEPAAASVVEA